ncbi:MAG: hypothetical protein CML23_14755 [Rhizobiaceae bacterium]|nr:hypothetical protein [Rhizobiaceae bacterium]|tara:strand:+ start:6533 stop:7309 length:777 start_codon:yes stop_codon:yes gene_type:complete
MISLPARLARGFAVDFLTGHSADAGRQILSPGYRLSISGHLFEGRDDSYMPATLAQLDQFPGLCVTCHDIVLGPNAIAMRFTEHGAQGKDGVISTWGGITMFRIVDGLLDHGWAEEDYFARKRQLKSRTPDNILPPHGAPWDESVLQPDPQTDRVVHAWLANPSKMLIGADEISAQGPRLADLIKPESVMVTYQFSAGARAAVHAVVSGRYGGGFSDVSEDKVGSEISVPIAAILDVADGAISRIQVCGDRLGLSRAF